MKRIRLPLLAVCLGAVAAPAHGAPLPVSGTLDLSDAPATQAVRWTGTEQGGLAGGAVAGIGDFDGDGRRDVAVGAPKRDSTAGRDSGVVHVLVAARGGGSLDDASKVVRIRGAGAGDFAGFDVSAAGDVNADGLADLLIGAPVAGTAADGTEGGGGAYLVLGRRGHDEIDLAGDFGGIRIAGAEPGSRLGRSVGTLPDVNGDKVAELVVSAPQRDVGDRKDAGSTYVIFGRASGDVDVGRLVENGDGYRIDGPAGTAAAGALSGRAVGSIGDLDGDGRAEVLVTAPGAVTAPRSTGAAYVVWGRESAGVVDLAQLGTQGYAITAPAARGQDTAAQPGDHLGESIAGLGDVNGDARPDLVVGAHLADGPDRARGGIAYVLYGKRDAKTVDLGKLGGDGYRVLGVGAQDQTGFATAPAGDFNADGLRDVVIAAPFADPLSRESAGAVYVVYGRKGGGPKELDLAEIGDRGIRIAGAAGDVAGFAVDGAGDVDGDGGDDLAIGAVGIDADYLANLRSTSPGGAALVLGAAGRPGEIPGAEIKADPGYQEELARGCRPAVNVQAVLDDDPYNDDEADPQRIRLAGMQTYVDSPRNWGTVLGVTSFPSRDEEGEEVVPKPAVEPTELRASRADRIKKLLFESISGEDPFPGYGTMFRTLADDNPSAGARIMVIDGYTFRSIRRLEGLTDGSAPTYIVAIGDPPDRNRSDVRQMKRVTRETKGRYYEAHTAGELDRALLAIQSRLRCDLEADDYQAELQGGDEEEIAEVDVEDDAYTADITLTWTDDDDDFEFEDIDVLDDEDDDVFRSIDDEEISEAYDESSPTALVTAGRGRTFRAVHLRGIRKGTRLRVTVRADGRKTSGRLHARVTQSRRRR